MRRPLLALTGLGLAGYGALVVLGVLPHDAPVAGILSLVAGAALLCAGLPPLRLRRGRVVAALGGVCVAGVLAYNLALGSGLGTPEWAILGYGTALLAAATQLHRRVGPTDVGTLVAWSFPLLLAPLAMFALNAALSTGGGGGTTAAEPIVHALVVVPTAWLLGVVGTPVALVGNNMLLPTPRGQLVLGVGLVCAGLYPMVLFGGMVALHAWQTKTAPRRLAVLLGLGLVGLWFLNLVRLVILTKVGQHWGGATLQTTHAHLGWILFAIFMVAFWALALRRRDEPAAAAPVHP